MRTHWHSAKCSNPLHDMSQQKKLPLPFEPMFKTIVALPRTVWLIGLISLVNDGAS